MIKISHETPLCYLEQSREINDYDYALVHLFDNKEFGERYFNFFKESLEMGRKVILDNSAYELGKPYDLESYLYYINELKPTEYIIPDFINSGEDTLFSLTMWKNLDVQGKAVGVVHGEDLDDFIHCYREMVDKVDKIAFSFDNFFFNQNLPLSEVRYRVISILADDNIIDTSKPHHLLGCILPQEFKLWKDIEWIETIDTSSPVLHAFQNIRFTEDGIKEKSKVKINDIFSTAELTDEIESSIKHNCEIFRNFLKK